MAVYTTVSAADLTAFLAQYDSGKLLSFSGISEGIENSNYFVRTTAGQFILTLFEKRVNPDELPYFLNLMTHLRQKGIICPLPIAGTDGKTLRDLCAKKACLTTFLEGKSVRDISPDHCAELGRAMARMHLAGIDYAGYRPNDLSVGGWEKLLAKIGRSADAIENGIYDEMAEALDFLKKNFPSGLPHGVIHADLFPDNVFFTRDKLSGIIDFYFACNDALAYELAVCLNAWCFEARTGRFFRDKAERMMTAYQQIRPLTPEEKDAFPLLAQGSALRFLLTRSYDWLNRPENALVTPKDPAEYIRKLRFHKQAGSFRDYGLI